MISGQWNHWITGDHTGDMEARLICLPGSPHVTMFRQISEESMIMVDNDLIVHDH